MLAVLLWKTVIKYVTASQEGRCRKQSPGSGLLIASSLLNLKGGAVPPSRMSGRNSDVLGRFEELESQVRCAGVEVPPD